MRSDGPNQDIVVQGTSVDTLRKYKKLHKQAVMNRKGCFKVQYNDQDERRPDIDIIPYFFFQPVQRYDKKANKEPSQSCQDPNKDKVKEQHIEGPRNKRLPKLPPLQYITEEQPQKIVFQKRNVTIKSGRKAQMVKVGKVFIIAIVIATKGFGFYILKNFLFDKCKMIKMCRKQYKAIIQRIITTAWKKLERVIRKYCKYNITPFTNQEIRLIHIPVQNMAQKLNQACRDTFVMYVKLCFHLERVTVSKQDSIALYKAIRKLLHNDPEYIKMKQYELQNNQNQHSTSPGLFPRFGGRRRQKKTNMFHKTYILRHLQHQIQVKEYNQLLDQIMQEVKDNQKEQKNLTYGDYNAEESQFNSKQIQEKQFKLKILKQLQLIASALYYKGCGINFYFEYLQEVSQSPMPQFQSVPQQQYDKYSKIVMRKLFRKLQGQIQGQKRKTVQFADDEYKQIIMILLNYKFTLNSRARMILQNYLVKIFSIQLEQGLLIEKISDLDALFLYKTILQQVNVKSSHGYLTQNKQLGNSAPKEGSRNNNVFSDVFGQSQRKQEFKRQMQEQVNFLRQKGLDMDEFQNCLIKLFLDQKQIKKIVTYINVRYPKGQQEFTFEMIINKISQLLYRGVLRTQTQKGKYDSTQLPQLKMPTEQQCKMMVLSQSGYLILKTNVFRHILQKQHFDLNHLYLIVNTINQGLDKLKIQIRKSQKHQKLKQFKEEMDEINKRTKDKDKDNRKQINNNKGDGRNAKNQVNYGDQNEDNANDFSE